MKSSSIFSMLVLLVAHFSPAQPSAPSLDTVLNTSVPAYTMDATNLLQSFSKAAADFNFKLGVEWLGSPTDRLRVSRSWANATVLAILTDLVQTDPRYELSISNSVVHVRPVAYAANPNDYLNVVVPSFSTKGLYTINAAVELRNKLRSQLATDAHSVPQAACGGSIAIGADETMPQVSLKNGTVLDILDALLTNSRFGMWIVIDTGKSAASGYLDTTPVYASGQSAVQPIWSFLPRYYDPVELKERGDWRATNVH